jgi:hypothetical protein
MGNINLKYDDRGFENRCQHYVKDNFNVYWNGIKVEEATSMSFQDLGQCYGKDSFDVFYKGNIINDANAFSFVVSEEFIKNNFMTQNILHNMPT